MKGRFAWGYATHKERVLTPMVRETIADPWREVSWEEAISYTAERLEVDPGSLTASAPSAASRPRAARTKRSS